MLSRREIKELVKKRVAKLLALAKNNKREKEYVKKAWNLLTKYNVRQTKQEKIRFCKRCFSLWDRDKYRVEIDTKNKRIIYICNNCNYRKVFKYKK